jgi:hypothetical protein
MSPRTQRITAFGHASFRDLDFIRFLSPIMVQTMEDGNGATEQASLRWVRTAASDPTSFHPFRVDIGIS